MNCPPAPYQHLLRMSDEVGLLEHASGIEPRLEHGYCVDDVARGLLVVCREPSPTPELVAAARRYLSFLADSLAPDGRVRNRMSYDRRWHGEHTVEDCWGRALWGLGVAAARGPVPEIRHEALALFDLGARARSPFSHAMAFAALGAAAVLDVRPGHEDALGILAAAVDVIGGPGGDPAWPWPTARLSYGNGSTVEAVIAAGAQLGRERVLRDGLAMLEWLLATETRGGHLSVTPAGGWGRGEPRPGFDQQPIEVAALSDACERAAAVTGDTGWLAGVQMSVAWFLGDNDAGVPMLDEATGGGCDGLRRASRNPNQGAESTLAMISVLQQGNRLLAQPR